MKRFSFVFMLLPAAVLLAIWESAATSARMHFLFASPSAVASSFWQRTVDGTLPIDALITGAEALLGFAIGCFCGTMLGFAFWYSPFAARVFRPYLFVLGTVPAFAFTPIIIVWFGIGFTMKVALAAFGTFLVSLSQAYEGAQNIERDELQLMKILGAKRIQVLQKVVFPASLSWVFSSLRLNIGFALLGAFIGEFISAEAGIGYFMNRCGALYDVAGVFAGGIYLVALGLCLHLLVTALEKQRIRIIGVLTVQKVLRAQAVE